MYVASGKRGANLGSGSLKRGSGGIEAIKVFTFQRCKMVPNARFSMNMNI